MPQSAWVYLHGIPGSHHEAALFGFETGTMFIPDRTGEALDIPTLAQEVEARFPNSPVSFIGFSMGAFVTVQLAVALGEKVDHIHLIAPAAPITDDRLLTAMAGAPIFRLARRSPQLFRAVTRLQAILGAVAPRLIFRSLFATAKGDERDLAADPEFERRWTAMARHCVRKGAVGHCSEILAFVKDWSSLPARVKAPVTVWHGIEDTLPRQHWLNRSSPLCRRWWQSDVCRTLGIIPRSGSHFLRYWGLRVGWHFRESTRLNHWSPCPQALCRKPESAIKLRIPELVEGLPSFFWQFEEANKQPFDKLRDTGAGQFN
jgi:pimeloyl-ACP methyl ester carboxylesterase